MKTVKFNDLDIGDEFKCYGDIYLNYKYPIVCKCIKNKNNIGKEISTDMLFAMDDLDEVWVLDIASLFDISTSKKCKCCGLPDGIHSAYCLLINKY